MLPKTRPGTYYIEMDPGVANAKDSKLSDELEHADLVILSRVWDTWDEPNDAREFGPDKPNEIVRKEFCTVKDVRLYKLLQRCDRQTR